MRQRRAKQRHCKTKKGDQKKRYPADRHPPIKQPKKTGGGSFQSSKKNPTEKKHITEGGLWNQQGDGMKLKKNTSGPRGEEAKMNDYVQDNSPIVLYTKKTNNNPRPPLFFWGG